MGKENKTKEQVVSEIDELRQMIDDFQSQDSSYKKLSEQLQQEITEHKRSESDLRTKSHDLGERVKELGCLYGLSKLVEKYDSLKDVISGLVEIVPPSWQYPEITCCRIIAVDSEFKSKDFEQTEWKQSSEIYVNGQQSGSIEVFYKQQCPEEVEGPFLKEERDLINALAERISRIIEQKQAEEALAKHKMHLEALVEQRTSQLGSANRKLKQEEQRLKAAQKMAHLGSWEWDIKTNREEWSEEQFRIFGYEPFQIKPDYECFLQAIHPLDKDEVVSLVNGALEKDQPYQIEFRIIRPDKSERTIFAQGKVLRDDNNEPVKMTGTVLDITERKQAEEELEKHRVFHEAVLECIAEGIVACDQEGTLAYFNRAMREFHGLPVEPIPPEEWSSHYDLYEADGKTPLTQERIPLLRTLKGEDVSSQEMVIAPKGLPVRILTVTGRMLTDSKGNPLGAVVSMNDITERKQVEQALAENEERFRAIADFTYDWESWISPEGKLLWVNSAVERLTGYSVGECKAMPDYPLSIIIQTDRQRMADKFEQARQKHSENDVEFQILTKDGTNAWMAISWQPIYSDTKQWLGYRSSVRDITVRKQAEEKLRDSEIKSRAWLEYSPVCTKIVDLDFNLQFMSTAGIEGLKIDDITEFYGKPYPLDFYPESFRNTMTKNLEKVKGTGEIITQEASVVDIEGNVLWYHSTLVPVNDDQGRIDYIIVVSMDITERKQAEEQLRDHQAQLAHVSRLTTAGELSSSLAHELNQPLCAIATISEGCRRLISSGKTGGDDITEGIEEISTQAARAGQIIRRMGQFVSKHPPKRSTVDINTVITESIDLIGVQARQQNVNIQYEHTDKNIEILADNIQLQQVLINLMQNGIEAMENTKSKQRKISISTSIPKEGFIEVAVKDNGKGFSKVDKEKLFQPFFTTKAEGIGIGLSISRSIIEAHGGHLSAESQPGIGSTFKVKLPLSEHEKTINES